MHGFTRGVKLCYFNLNVKIDYGLCLIIGFLYLQSLYIYIYIIKKIFKDYSGYASASSQMFEDWITEHGRIYVRTPTI